MVVGHEFVGEVVAVGSNVNDFHPGEIVSAEGHVVCGRCRNGLAGRRHLCKATVGIGVNRTGAFAEYISVPMTTSGITAKVWMRRWRASSIPLATPCTPRWPWNAWGRTF
jgi:threonine dehydrogenase-like Zn-dependent dehydrogenase